MMDNGKIMLCMVKVLFFGREENIQENINVDKNMVKDNITGILILIMMVNGCMDIKMDKEP